MNLEQLEINIEKLELNIKELYYYIGLPFKKSCLFPIIINKNNNNINEYSNDNIIYKKHDYFENNNNFNEYMKNIVKNINNCNPEKIKGQNVLLITSWSIGTGHGYAQLYNILIHYFKLYNLELSSHNFIVYKNSQKGIKEIINFLIPNNRIIYLEENKYYDIENLIIIKPTFSNFLMEFNKILQPFLYKFFFSTFTNIINNKKKICIVKTNNDVSMSENRDFDYQSVSTYCKKNNYLLIDHSKLTEIQIMELIYNCEDLLLSWGTTHFKHYIYISEICKKITILVLNNSGYEYEYKFMNNFKINKFKNANIIYILENKFLKNLSD